MTTLMQRRWCVLAMLSLASHSVGAQETRDAVPQAPDPSFCFQPAPAASCHAFMITELDMPIAMHRSGSDEITSGRPVFRPQIVRPINGVLGVMVNRGNGSALGGALFTNPGERRFGVVARYRKWLGDRGAVDVSAGPMTALLHAPNLSDSQRGTGVTADLAVTWYDWIGLSVRGEALRARDTSASGVYAGVRVGSVPAVVISAVTGAAILLVARDR